MKRRILLALFAVFALLAASCGSDDDDDSSDTTEAPSAESTTDDTEAMEEETTDDTEAMEEETTDDTEAMEEEEGAVAPEGAVAVSLTEFVIGTEPTLATGTVTFFVTNDGEFPHEFGITKGTAYEDLPLIAENGSIDEAALGADVLGKTAQLEPGETATIDFEIEAGEYVLFCNIAFGPNSHAANGQTLSATAS